MKDFDDLFRISRADQEIDFKLVQKISTERGIVLELDLKWINSRMSDDWLEYTKKRVNNETSDLPNDLNELFDIINKFVIHITKIA